MSYLHPFSPLILDVPGGERVCLDRSTDEERRRELAQGTVNGLARLIRHPHTPATGQEGLDSGIWRRGERGVYLHREDYALPGGIEKSRWSVAVELDPETCPLRPVVEADGAEVEGLVDAVLGSGVDPGGVAALYRDENHHLEQLVEARAGIAPLSSVQDPIGGRHSLWRLSDEEGEAVIALLERCGSAIVGDVALYRAILRLRGEPGFSPRLRPLVHFYHQRDFGVSFAATARLHPMFPGFDINSFLAWLHDRYDVREYPVTAEGTGAREFLEQVRTDGITRRVTGLLVSGARTAFEVMVREGEQPGFGGIEPTAAAAEFDVEWVQRGIVDVLFPPDQRICAAVLADPRRAPEALAEGGDAIAFVVNPPPKRFIPMLSQEGTRLPVGALQVRPAVPRGLLLSPLPTLKLLS